jgi:hypothetical protein
VIKVTSEITQEGYTTSLDCVFHSNDGLQAQANEECKFSELEKAGLYNPDGEGVSPPSALLIKVLQEQTTEAQKAADEKEKKELAEQQAVQEFTKNPLSSYVKLQKLALGINDTE